MELSKILIKQNTTILETLKVIDEAAVEIALVVNEQQKLIGTVTDGDIRRGLIRGAQLNETISGLMNPSPITAELNTSDDELLFMMTNRSIKHLPIVAADGRVIRLVLLNDLVAGKKRPNIAVIMAGGLGSRLGDLTKETPKPLLPVGGRPIISIIVDQLRKHGITDIFVSINYKADKIKAYFNENKVPNTNISYLEEKEFLGTAGSLSLLKQREDNDIIVINGDILSPINFASLLDFHKNSGKSMTICTREFNLQIPYGVLQMKGNELISIEEKPSQNMFINAGCYILAPNLLRHIPYNKRFDMPQLIDIALKQEKGVCCYPVSDFWLDIGSPKDYHKAGKSGIVNQISPL